MGCHVSIRVTAQSLHQAVKQSRSPERRFNIPRRRVPESSWRSGGVGPGGKSGSSYSDRRDSWSVPSSGQRAERLAGACAVSFRCHGGSGTWVLFPSCRASGRRHLARSADSPPPPRPPSTEDEVRPGSCPRPLAPELAPRVACSSGRASWGRRPASAQLPWGGLTSPALGTGGQYFRQTGKCGHRPGGEDQCGVP